MKKPFVSVVIPIEGINEYARQCFTCLGDLDYPNFEVLVFTTETVAEKFPRTRFLVNPELARRPAEKRDLALKYAKGEILAFIDDDAYPRKDWLRNAVEYFEDSAVAAVCGPGVTPSEDSRGQKVSGWIQASKLGGGNYTYRFLPQKKRLIDDYPSMNLIVRKSDFEKVGGFDSHFWPGEDTKLCHDFVYGLNKKIVYDPQVLVYHHRRGLWRPHLRQIGRYGLHRGHFARILPKTSCRLSYFVPTLFTLFIFMTPLLLLFLRNSNAAGGGELAGIVVGLPWYQLWRQLLMQPYAALLSLATLLITVYSFLLLYSAAWVYSKERSLRVAFLTIPGIFLTHVYYGLRFIQGFFSRSLKR